MNVLHNNCGYKQLVSIITNKLDQGKKIMWLSPGSMFTHDETIKHSLNQMKQILGNDRVRNLLTITETNDAVHSYNLQNKTNIQRNKLYRLQLVKHLKQCNYIEKTYDEIYLTAPYAMQDLVKCYKHLLKYLQPTGKIIINKIRN